MFTMTFMDALENVGLESCSNWIFCVEKAKRNSIKNSTGGYMSTKSNKLEISGCQHLYIMIFKSFSNHIKYNING